MLRFASLNFQCHMREDIRLFSYLYKIASFIHQNIYVFSARYLESWKACHADKILDIFCMRLWLAAFVRDHTYMTIAPEGGGVVCELQLTTMYWLWTKVLIRGGRWSKMPIFVLSSYKYEP